ncbi:MAG: shikimate dehydrogenase [Christensenella sp.]
MVHKNYCVIGSPVAHSLSPVIHNTLYKIYGIDSSYAKHQVTADTLLAFIHSAHTENIAGFNVTMPLKKAILPYLKYVSPEARSSVNTVSVKPDGLYGYSTDAQGFYAALQNIGKTYKDTEIVFIGAGAVTRLLVHDAARKGAKKITLLNRTIEHAQKLAQEVNAAADLLSNIELYTKNCDLLINTTPLGMSGSQYDFASLDFINTLPKYATVCDLIYSPARTTLLARAHSCGLTVMNGLPMLIRQAFLSFEKWFDILPAESAYTKVLNQINELLFP